MALPLLANGGGKIASPPIFTTTCVFPADQVPEVDKAMHCCFILNTERRGHPGTHWLALFYNHYVDTLEYFDSYGMTLETYAVVHECLPSRGLLLLCTPSDSVGSLQLDGPFVRGQYCIAFPYWRAKYISVSPTHFSVSLAIAHSAALRRDKCILKIVLDLLSRGNFCTDMLTRSECTQSCTCVASRRG
jgi:hypothetical protein